MALAQHLTVRLWNSAVIAPSLADRQRALGSVLRSACPFGLLAASLADTHGHIVVVGDRATAGELARRVAIGLQRCLELPIGFEPARFTPVLDQRHLHNSFWYVHRQLQHHGLEQDPWHAGTTLPDLVGLRVLAPALGERVRQRLPRVGRQELLDELGWSGGLWSGAVDLEAVLGPAARAAVGSEQLGRRGRTAAVQVGRMFGSQREVAQALGIDRRTVQRLEGKPLDEGLTYAVHGQVSWRCERG